MPTLAAPTGAPRKKNASRSAATSHQPPNPNAPINGSDQWQIVWLPVARIDPSPYQPRTVFDPEELEELTQSVRANGVQQPVLVRTKRLEEGIHQQAPRYELIGGERRLRACLAAGRKTLPAIVRDDLSDLEAAELALGDNVQRQQLSPIEEARGYRRLMLEFKLSETRLSKKVGKSVPAIREIVKLLLLPEEVQDLLARRQLTSAHGYELLKLAASPKACHAVALHAASNGLSAASLSRELLPNARDLKKRGLVAELGFGTKFDWRTACKECPLKAFVQSGYSSYCLQPEEWNRKQLEAAARQQDEQARVLEEARASLAAAPTNAPANEGSEPTDVAALPCLSKLPQGSYRNLSWGERPAGCDESCPCRGAARDANDSEKAVPICLDPERYQALVREERDQRDVERQRLATQKCEKALRLLQEGWEDGDPSRILSLCLLPFIDGRIAGGYQEAGQWETLVRSVARFLQIDLTFEVIFDEEADDLAIIEALAASLAPASDSAEREPLPTSGLRSIALAAGMLLANEARSAARWGGDTPLLDFVLGTQEDAQMGLDILDGPSDAMRDTGDGYFPDEGPAEDEPRGTDFPGSDEYLEDNESSDDDEFPEDEGSDAKAQPEDFGHDNSNHHDSGHDDLEADFSAKPETATA